MGVPAFFRWLSRKYPAIVVPASEGAGKEYHFDNLYLDMNGIIHPCSHPENKAPPETEEEMFQAIFEYIEMIMKIVRPQKLLYMAVDGVAPRAKMNQQRSRRFRAAKESQEKRDEIEKIVSNLKERGCEVPKKENKVHFDSNVITPGTVFMMNLAEALREWIDHKLSSDTPDEAGIWPKDMMIVLSDASIPGEGEHKIMEYIRKQKAQSTYDPNISHCLYGADADLIMLGLATHEMNFTILREEFKPNQPRPCEICDQYGHDMNDCQGLARDESLDDEPPILSLDPEFIFIRLNVLREYLQNDIRDAPKKLELERFVDDFVFLCFFVGNDFLPHLPSLEIREGAIDRLVKLYLDTINQFEGDDIYLTKDGFVNLERCGVILEGLGRVEDEIFQNRQRSDIRFKARRKRQKLEQQQEKLRRERNAIQSQWLEPESVKDQMSVMYNARQEAARIRSTNINANMNAAQRLKSMLVESPDDSSGRGSQSSDSALNSSYDSTPGSGTKRKASDESPTPPRRDYAVFTNKGLEDTDSEPEDLVQLWEEGWKSRYYYHKFDCINSYEMSKQVAKEYVIGLCWVLRYYYQGCPDWKWFYPYHYAPFASDFQDVASIKVEFDSDAQPFSPLEQLMSVFPAASSMNLPPTWRKLMMDVDSPIIDFYPSDFKIDLNGKTAAWMGVALLPFIDEVRMFETLSAVYPNLSKEEKERNKRGTHLLFISRKEDAKITEFLTDVIKASKDSATMMNPSDLHQVAGLVRKSPRFSQKYTRSFCVEFFDPIYPKGHVFPAKRLEGAVDPPITLKPEDFDERNRGGQWTPRVGMSNNRPHMHMSQAGGRMLQNATGQSFRTSQQGSFQQSYQSRDSQRQGQTYGGSYQASYYGTNAPSNRGQYHRNQNQYQQQNRRW